MKPHELANLIFQYADWLGENTTIIEPGLLGFAHWLKDQDTNANPYTYLNTITETEYASLKAHKDRGPGYRIQRTHT